MSTKIHPAKIRLTVNQIAAVRGVVDATDPDDAQLMLDMVSAETDADELIASLLLAHHEETAAAAATKAVIDKLAARRSAAEARAATFKALAAKVAEEIDVTPIRTPVGTLYRVKGRDGVMVHDADALPDDLVTIVRKPDMRAIGEAVLKEGRDIPGASRKNGAPTWAVRT